jgi:hypothetical protein
VELTVAPHARASALDINVRVLGSDQAVLQDVLVHWEPGSNPVFEVPTNQRFGRVQLRVWRAGRLFGAEDATFILEVGINIQVTGRTLVLNDRLTNLLRQDRSASKAPAPTLREVQVVTQHSASLSSVGGSSREPWRESFLGGPGEVFALARPQVPAPEYFPRGGGGRATAILAFARLLERNARSFLVDPFFDDVGAADLLPRVAADVDLTIITSLPDDGRRPHERLVAYLERASGYLPHGIKVHRVTRADSTEQAFHDRYLVVMGGEARPRGFLLSNSFSGLARNYPMVVAEMSAGATGAVLDDIERLLESQNIEALWPPPRAPGPPRPLHDSFGLGWRWYLRQLLPEQRGAPSSWIPAGREAGWLDVDSEGNPRWSSARSGEVLERIFPRARTRSRFGAGQTKAGSRPRLRPVGAALGFRVAVLGERVARGLDLSASGVAARLPRGALPALVAWLRSSFRPTAEWERAGHWLTRMGLHQSLRDATVTLQRVRQGLGLYGDTHTAMDLTQDFGRTFVYKVLLALVPDAAFALGVELGDLDVLVAALDWAQPEPWPSEWSNAAMRSTSAMVVALGCQTLAAPDARGNFDPQPEPPSPAAIPGMLVGLRHANPAVVALALFEWARTTRQDEARSQFVAAAVDRVESISPGALADVCEAALGNVRLLGALVRCVEVDRAATSTKTVGAALRAAFKGLVTTASNEQAWRQCAACAEVLAGVLLAGAPAGEVTDKLEPFLELERARSELVPLSPFRRHPSWQAAAARVAVAHLIVLHGGSLVPLGQRLAMRIPWRLVGEASPALFGALVNAMERCWSGSPDPAYFARMGP